MVTLGAAARQVARRITPEACRAQYHSFRHHAEMARAEGLGWYAALVRQRTRTWIEDALAARGYYAILTPGQAAARRRSETVFVFGSGYSLNDLTAREWAHIADHDVFGFSGFIFQQWIRTDFHLVRAWDATAASVRRWPGPARAYAERLAANRLFDDAVLFLQRGHSAVFANTLVGQRLLPRGTRICRFRFGRRLGTTPATTWGPGFVRGGGTLTPTVNVAYLLGWREIVLIGVDLYDGRYFWGPPDATLDFDERGDFKREVQRHNDGQGPAWNAQHRTVDTGIVDVLEPWARLFAAEGVRLSVYNPKSLLAGPLPVYGA